jgi:hypothetical protein
MGVSTWAQGNCLADLHAALCTADCASKQVGLISYKLCAKYSATNNAMTIMVAVQARQCQASGALENCILGCYACHKGGHFLVIVALQCNY